MVSYAPRSPYPQGKRLSKYLYILPVNMYMHWKIYIHRNTHITNIRKCLCALLLNARADSGGLSVGQQSLACWNCGFNSRRWHGCLCLVRVVCCQVEVSATRWSLVQRSPTECGVSECHHKNSIMRRPRPTSACCAMKKKLNAISLVSYLCHLHSYASCSPTN